MLTAGLTASLQLYKHRGKQQQQAEPLVLPWGTWVCAGLCLCISAAALRGSQRASSGQAPGGKGRASPSREGEELFPLGARPTWQLPGEGCRQRCDPQLNPPGAAGFAQPPCERCGGSRQQQRFKVTKSGAAKAAASPGQSRMLFSPEVQHRNDKRQWCSWWAESQDAAIKIFTWAGSEQPGGWECRVLPPLTSVRSPACP